jgi:hypothetical protein
MWQLTWSIEPAARIAPPMAHWKTFLPRFPCDEIAVLAETENNLRKLVRNPPILATQIQTER